MRQQHATLGLGDQMLGHAAENKFAKPRMTVRASDNNSRANVGCHCVELNGRIPVLILLRHELRGGNTVTRQPRYNIADP